MQELQRKWEEEETQEFFKELQKMSQYRNLITQQLEEKFKLKK